MSLKNLFFVTISLFFFSEITAQQNYDEYNQLGIFGGFNIFDINTSNFNTNAGNGFSAGFVTRGDVYNNFDLEYGVSFHQNKLGIFGRDFANPLNNFDEQYIDYELQSVQVKLLAGYNIIMHHLSIDAGPILNVNGKLKLKDESFKNYVLDGYDTLKASEIDNVSRVHFHLAAGITAGLKNFRVNAQYQYGVSNLFARFDDQQALATSKPEGGFKGNTSTIIIGAYLYF